MSYTAVFQGNIVVDGTPEGEGVSVFLTEESLVLSKAGDRSRRTKIYVSPFNHLMVFTQDPRLMKTGFFFEIRGTHVGAISVGPLGHPGDGEYDYRPMTSFRVDVKYFFDRIKVDVSGTTTTGTSGFDINKALSPWTFSAHFEIPKKQIPEFFRLTDFVRDNIFKLFGEVFGSTV